MTNDRKIQTLAPIFGSENPVKVRFTPATYFPIGVALIAHEHEGSSERMILLKPELT